MKKFHYRNYQISQIPIIKITAIKHKKTGGNFTNPLDYKSSRAEEFGSKKNQNLKIILIKYRSTSFGKVSGMDNYWMYTWANIQCHNKLI